MRRFAAALVFALSFGLFITGCDSEVSGLEDTEDAYASSQSPATASQQGSTQEATLSRQLNTVRAVTREYRDLETAREDGYVAVSPYVPGMGFHFANSSPPFGTDRDDPPVLVYFTNGSYNPAPGEAHDPARDDDLVLGAVEYIVPGDRTASPPNIFADEASPRLLKVTEEEGWHFESAEGFTGLHAWVHRGNPAGVFHHTNPNID